MPHGVILQRNKLAALYDSIALLYLASDEFQSYWRGLETEFDKKIKIFYAETPSIENAEFKTTKANFIVGINILLSCNSHIVAHQLNNLYNTEGKYFIGFNFFAHVYGTSFIKCKTSLNCINNYFLESDEYKAIIGEGEPVIKLIKLMFYLFKNECSKCRECVFFKKEQIKNKIRAIVDKMNKPKIEDRCLGPNESYFKENIAIDCVDPGQDCHVDEAYESFISAKLAEERKGPESYDYSNKIYFK
jgi:hypothetical protein